MARIRNIGPRFFEDETMAKLPLGGRLLYIGMWTRCDLNGVFEWNVKVLTAALFPHDDGIDAATVEKWLQMLVELGRVTRFEAAGKRYGFLPRFSVHQAISKAERDQDKKNRVSGRGSYPVPPTDYKTVSGTVPETPDEGQRTRDEGQGTQGAVPDPSSQQIEDIMAKDRATSAQVAREPPEYTLQDWRMENPRVGIARGGEDGDMDAWRSLWRTYGRECFDPMYQRLVKTIPEGKKIWFSQAAEWLAKNTSEVPK